MQGQGTGARRHPKQQVGEGVALRVAAESLVKLPEKQGPGGVLTTVGAFRSPNSRATPCPGRLALLAQNTAAKHRLLPWRR